MKLSIITINYNNKFGLCNTIDSVAVLQRRHLFEFLIIDGGSTDGSISNIKNNLEFIDYWISEKDNGIYDAMNKGIAKATGDYLMFLNSGDSLVDAEVLSRCVDKLIANDTVDILYGDLLVHNHKNVDYKVHTHPNMLTLPFFENDTINHQASLIRRSLFQDFGLYRLDFKLASDYHFFLTCFLRDKVFKHAGFNMVNYDFGGQSSVDDFRNYKAEQKLIWDLLVPRYVDALIQERRMALATINELTLAGSYKLVRLGSSANYFLQKVRAIFKK